MKVHGIIVPVATPVDTEERIEERGLRRLVRHLVDSGIHGILANGTMAAFAYLDDCEQIRAIEIVLDEVDGRVPVIVNIGENGSKKAIRRARQVESLRPDYLSFLPPFYFKLTQIELQHFFEDIFDTVETASFIYNNPRNTGNNIELKTILALGELPNVVGIKDSEQNLDKWLRMVRAFRGKDFAVLAGTECLASAALGAGCHGVIAGLHNLWPRLAVQLHDAATGGNPAAADRIQQQLIELVDIFTNEDLWGAFEVALQYLNICQKVTLIPFRSIADPARRAQITRALSSAVNQPTFDAAK